MSLIERLGDRDEFYHIALSVDVNSRLALALTCKTAYNAVLKSEEPLKTTYASLISSIGLMKWAMDIGCPHNTKIWIEEAAFKGRLDIIRWLSDTIGIEWNASDAAENAALGGHIHILEWAHQDGDKDLSWVYNCAALCGHTNILEWAKNKNILIGEFGDSEDVSCVSNAAAEGGHLETLDWLRHNGFKWDSFTTAGAARGGHLDILVWLREEGCDWTTNVYIQAAKRGNLAIVKWAYANGLSPGSCNLCEYAEKGGHKEMLEWARENGF